MFTFYPIGQNATGARFNLEKDPTVVGALLAESYSDGYVFSWLTDSTPRTFFEVASKIVGIKSEKFSVKLTDHSSRNTNRIPLQADKVQSIRMADADAYTMLKWQRVEDPGLTDLVEGGIKLPKPSEGEDVPLGMLQDLWRNTGTVALANEAEDLAARVRVFLTQV